MGLLLVVLLMGGGWWGRCDPKRQYLRRLHKRFGKPWLLTFDSDFTFACRGTRWTNPEQLEAIVEFYTNFRSSTGAPCGPWVKDANPLSPGDSGYQEVHFRPPQGKAATLDGAQRLKLDGEPDLQLIRINPPDAGQAGAAPFPPLNNVAEPTFTAVPNYPAPQRYLFDTITLDADTARPSKRYRITAVNNTDHTVDLDAAPRFKDAASSSAWTMHTRPILVIIDPVGARERARVRLEGDQARVLATTSSTAVAAGPVTVTPGSMDGIAVGLNLEVDAGTANETVVVTAVAPPTFTATFAKAHSGTWKIIGRGKPHETVVVLDAAASLERVNPRFDTIYFVGDTVTGRGQPFRAYRIVKRDNSAHTVIVDGAPDLGANRSRWYIQAGVGADEVPTLNYNIDPGPTAATRSRRESRGYDHYDGLMFVVHEAEVIAQYRWNSYTSRWHGPWHDAAFGTADGWDQMLSTIAGNRAYFYESFLSGNAFINYAFSVRDLTATNAGVRHVATDSCADAWFYFGTPQQETVAEPDGTLDDHVTQDLGNAGGAAAGKTLIRIHRGNLHGTMGGPIEWCGSAGCFVSPEFAALRTLLIGRYKDEYKAFHGTKSTDTKISQVPGGAPPATDWNLKLCGVFWVIRPDEPPPS